jgi:hypothetical protein
MLEQGYIELIGITDPTYSGRLTEALARYEGLHIVAFGTDDTSATIASLKKSGIPEAQARMLERPIEHRGKTELARFEIIDFGDALPEIYSFAIRHVTPDALWKPELLSHPNGVKSLEAIAIAVADVDEFAARLARTVGGEAKGDTAKSISLSRGTAWIIGKDAVPSLAGKHPPPLPAVLAMTLGVSNLDTTADVLRKGGLDFRRSDKSIVVAPEEACGTTIEFAPV